MSTATSRILKELQDIGNNPSSGISTGPLSDDNLFHWVAVLDGPPDSPYKGDTFELDVVFPTDYPSNPPKIKFKTKISHTNIDSNGNISLATLGSDWSPALTVTKLLNSIYSLLSDR